jgi:hypothetical protein
MKKNSIVQFVCFQTELELNTFIVSWEQYSKSLGKDVDVLLHQQQSGKKKFKYVSRHTSSQDDFRFVFVKGKKPEHFVDYSVRVIQAGGEQFKKLELYEDLNIYQAYFESSAYSYILEYFVTDKLVDSFLLQLKTLCNDDEIGVYKECALQEA